MAELILNPNIELVLVHREGRLQAITAIAPVRGRPLSVSTVDREQEPAIFDVLSGTAAGRAVDAELDRAGWERLAQLGFLVPADRVSHRVLFDCPLRAPLEALPLRARAKVSGIGAALIVNPSLRFSCEPGAPDEGRVPKPRFMGGTQPRAKDGASRGADEVNPFDARRAWAHVEHADVSAASSIAIDREQDRAEIARLRPGESAPADLEPELRAALVRADVLVDPDRVERRRAARAAAIEEAARAFARDLSVPVRDLLHPTQVAALRRYYRELIAEGHVRLLKRYHAHDEPMARVVLNRLTRVVGEVVGQPVKPAYAYLGSYEAGARLAPHRDRPQCAYSVSLQIDFHPEPEDLSPWPLFMELEPGKHDPPRFAAHRLGLGDGVVYRGDELTHYRDVLGEGQRSTSIFLHYVAEDFEGRLD